MIQFTHNLMSGPSQQIPAMNRVKKILKDANFTNRVFPMCIGYASWETDEVKLLNKNYYVIRSAGCADSRYTLKSSFIF